MKLKGLHHNKKGSNYNLVLEVYVKEGRELAHGQLGNTCNPIALVSLPNSSYGVTKKAKHTTRPYWNSKVKLKAFEDIQATNPSLKIVVYDVQKKQPLEYLGEARINLKDIRFGSDYQWLSLHSTKSEKRYVTGSIYVRFELKKRKKRLRKGYNSSANLRASEFRSVELTSLWESYLHIIDPLAESRADLTLTDDQGFYKDDAHDSLAHYIDGSDLGEEEEDEEDDDDDENSSKKKRVSTDHLLADLQVRSGGSETDISSLTDENKDSVSHSSDAVTETHSNDKVLLQLPRPSKLMLRDNFNGSQTDFESTDNASYSNSNLGSQDGSSTSRRRFRMKGKKKNRSYQFSSERDVLGVVFLEIISAEGLPPFKSATRTGFDMDPFVIVSFGRKVFRSSWRSHTLSPTFNERLAFEVLPSEKNFEIQFNVLDKDHFSYHDNVGTAKIPVTHLMDDEQLDQSLQEENPHIILIEPGDDVASKRKKKLIGRNPERNLNKSANDSKQLRTFCLKLSMNNSISKLTKQEGVTYSPTLKIRARFEAYNELRQEFWMNLLTKYDEEGLGHLDALQLEHFLGTIGCSLSDATLQSFFTRYDRNPWSGETLTLQDIVENFEYLINQKNNENGSSSEVTHFFEVPLCPICNKKRLTNKNETDIVTHVAICASKDWSTVNKMLEPSFASSQMATKRWYSKVLIKLTYGKYGIGRNSANILVQDRNTGLIMEEKMSVYVRLGIKLFYRSFFDKAIDKKKMKRLLRNLSIKQGAKFDSVASASQIASFIQFHQLDLTECAVQNISSFRTFNQFFYRRLKLGARPLEANDPMILCSPCDSRCTVFQNVSLAKEIWIKGKDFSIEKLLYKNKQGYLLPEQDVAKYVSGSIGIFRLAPQDYHRFHSPCDGVIGKPKFIDGEYYTVNPMAIRSELDVFGDNVRCIIPIETENFGTIIMIPIGAMMVGSILLTVEEGEEISRGDEVGYFKFGGSTVLLLFEQGKFVFDSDLIANSQESIETLVRVGMSLGHAPSTPEFKRVHHDFDKQPEENKLRIIRSITGGAGLAGPSMNKIDSSLVEKLNEQKPVEEISLKELSWEALNMTMDEEDEKLLKGLDLDDVSDE